MSNPMTNSKQDELLATTANYIDELLLWRCEWRKDERGYYSFSNNGYDQWRSDYDSQDKFWNAFLGVANKYNGDVTEIGNVDKISFDKRLSELTRERRLKRWEKIKTEFFSEIKHLEALAKLDGAIEENRQHLSSINSSPDVNNDVLSMPFNYRITELKAQRQTLLSREE